MPIIPYPPRCQDPISNFPIFALFYIVWKGLSWIQAVLRTGEAKEISRVLPSDPKICGGEQAKIHVTLNGRKTAKTTLENKNPRSKWSEDFVFDQFWGHTGAERR